MQINSIIRVVIDSTIGIRGLVVSASVTRLAVVLMQVMQVRFCYMEYLSI